MRSADDIIVISDLHLAAERDQGLFQADAQLVEFLQWVHNSLHRCFLVINGDVFDFLVGREASSLNLDEAVVQVESIAANHREILEILGAIASSNDHELFILGGNHDPELALPEVQRRLEHHLNSHSSRPLVRWLTNGEAALFHVGLARVLIEHGDQYDSWNWIDHEALRRVICLASRNVAYEDVYKLPPGSQLVINRFNPIREKFRWLETLQPFSPSILPLALEVILPTLPPNERDRLIRSVKELKTFGRRALADRILAGLDRKSEYWANDDHERQFLNEWLALYEKQENVWSVLDNMEAALVRAATRLRSLTAKTTLKHISRTNSFFNIDELDGQSERVTKLISKGTDVVVHGHTHSAKAHIVSSGLYLNTGTWGQLTQLPDCDASTQDWVTFMEAMRLNRTASFGRPTFVRICKQEEQTQASLQEWKGNRSQSLSKWHFRTNGWGKD